MDELDDRQVWILRMLYSISLILFFILSCFVGHNAWCYLYKARLGSHLVILFYILASIVVVFDIILFLISAVKPEMSKMHFIYDAKNFSFQILLGWVS